MIQEIEKLLEEYTNWLANKTHIKAVKDSVEITTPFLDRNNDYIQIYVKETGNGYLLTDDSYTISDLVHSGCNLESDKRQDILNITLRGFGVKNINGELVVEATRNNFAQKKHSLLQTILALNDLFYLSSPFTTSIFLEDVTDWLKLKRIRYVSDAKFTGASGFDHIFDFTIPASVNYPARYIRTINNPARDTAESFAFAWIDIKDVRSNSSAIAILNDNEKKISPNVVSAFLNYDIKPIPWSEREESAELLIG
jgi:hypothetical protein